MDALMLEIETDPLTPPHLADYIFGNAHSGTQEGLNLYDALAFMDRLDRHASAIEAFDHVDGSPFRKLAYLVRRGLQSTRNKKHLNDVLGDLSQRLSRLKDQHGQIEVDTISPEAAELFLQQNQESVRHSNPELEW